jgi:hypothetical protein
MEGVAEEAFRHVRRPAAVADLEPFGWPAREDAVDSRLLL